MKFGLIYVKKKDVKPEDCPDYGDCWTYISKKRNSGFLISFASGKRTEETCQNMLDKQFKVMDLPFPEKKPFFQRMETVSTQNY
jgi:hypothetical protein